ncbi:hypothetical protein LAV72_05730 [Lysinibacillus xylanilyticus]|uniref:hypothetical protein n=1 Tax=Lysinibacillus xylanilyticus TaxID=582475 RepID=UPI002B24C0F9|nr:hypothetical protein [Lysinibacillus xylanilyticus]MEB2299123.1 hypothetical protein [Lysinibacillus xylanilyticus]
MYKRKNSIIVAITNIILVCVAPILYDSMLFNIIDIALFKFIIFPLIIVVINSVLWFSKFKVEFYEHMLWAYIAYFLSVIVSFVLIIDPSKEKPPGETLVLHADFLMILYITFVQCIFLLFLNGILYIILKKIKKY